MRAVVQRVARARVLVDDQPVGEIGRGLLVLLGCLCGDDAGAADRMADAVGRLRCFNDAAGRMNLDLAAVGGEVLVVSQFTLAWDGSKGRRPSFDRALAPERAAPLVERVVARLRAQGHSVATGRFGASMQVELVNDGPVTFHLERLGEAPGSTQVLS
ncbi:MAG: D-aminoacyl-tRNA deacylase [Planctomycetota bacterium]